MRVSLAEKLCTDISENNVHLFNCLIKIFLTKTLFKNKMSMVRKTTH